MRLGALVLTAPEPRKACRGAKFPGARLLRAKRRPTLAQNGAAHWDLCTRGTAIRFHPQSDKFLQQTIVLLTPPHGPSLHQCSAALGQIVARSSAKALPSIDKKRGTKIVAPVDLNIAIAELKDVTASEARPVRTNSQLLTNPPDAFQNSAPFSSASAASSSACALELYLGEAR